MKIVFPELKRNPIAKTAVKSFPNVEFLMADDLKSAAEMVAEGRADSMISGLDYSSRDVLLAYKDQLLLKSDYFSSCFVCERVMPMMNRGATLAGAQNGAGVQNGVGAQNAGLYGVKGVPRHFVLADGGVNKMPNKEQLLTIVEDSARTFEMYYGERPRIAMLSYSTNGSGGKNPDLVKIHYAIEKIQKLHPEWVIDGEMQLDAAVNPGVAAKKVPKSPLRGQANVLITPDLNSGNILYKALEQFGGYVMAGPMIQGFGRPTADSTIAPLPLTTTPLVALPLADLSRGSSVNDVVLTLRVLIRMVEKSLSMR